MINILSLYYDLLNLYGENGNLRAIKNELSRHKLKVNIDYKSIGSKINFKKYDIIYIGSGSEEAIKDVSVDIRNRQEDLKKYIESNKYLIITGNSIELFGKYIKSLDGIIKTADIFSYHAEYLKENAFKNASTNRIVGETISTSKLIKEKIIGFQNRCSVLHNVKKPFLETNTKYSNDLEKTDEGFHFKNVYATYNIGPLLIRNPYLLENIIKKILKDKKIKYINEANSTAKQAYKKYLENFYS